MNVVYDIWTCEAQKVIVSHQRLGVLFEFIPSEAALFKLMLLDHGPHPTIENHDPLLKDLAEF